MRKRQNKSLQETKFRSGIQPPLKNEGTANLCEALLTVTIREKVLRLIWYFNFAGGKLILEIIYKDTSEKSIYINLFWIVPIAICKNI